MRALLAAVCVTAFFAAPSFAATQPNPTQKERELVAELMRVTHADQMSTQVMDAVLEQSQEQMLASAKGDPDELAEKKKAFERFRELMREKIDFKTLLEDIYVQLYVKYFTDDELEQLVAFNKSAVGQKVTSSMPALMRDAMQMSQTVLMPKVTEVTELFLKELEKGKPWERTMSDIRTIATAAEAYAIDHDDAYPRAADIEELRKFLEPDYVKTLPVKDVWGNAYAWLVSPDAKHYRVVSAGADSNFAWDSRQIVPVAEGQAMRVSERAEDDIVYADGRFIQVPKASQPKQPAKP